MRSQRGCHVEGCERPPSRNGYCLMHGRMEHGLKCQMRGCNRARCNPVSDGLCSDHHPAHKTLTTVEALAVQATAQGANPVQALQAAGLSEREAKREVKAQRKRPAFQVAMRKLARKAGVKPEAAMAAIGRALEAEKTRTENRIDEDGNVTKVVALVPDHKVQLMAAELYQKAVHGMAPKQTQHKIEETRTGVVFLTEKAPLPPELRAVVVDDEKGDD